MSLYVGPEGTERLGDILRKELTEPWERLRFATAYAKMSGIDHLHDVLDSFASSPGQTVRASIGIDQHGTSYEALAALLELIDAHGHELFVCYNPRSKGAVASPTFHPKIWLFDDGGSAKLLVGSGNLTQGGLYTNHEVGTVQLLDLDDASDCGAFDDAVEALDRWADSSHGDVKRLDQGLLDDLYRANLVLSEDEIRRAARAAARTRVIAGKGVGPSSIGTAIFSGEDFQEPPIPPGGHRSRKQPPSSASQPSTHPVRRSAPQTAAPSVPQHRAFYIHLSTAKKTEIYLAQAPLREDPAFFGLPFTGRTEPKVAGNPGQPQANPWPRSDVTIYDATSVVGTSSALPTKMWQYMEGESANKDVRIYFNAELQRLIKDGSVCVMELDPRPGVDYAISIYAPGHPDFAQFDAKCVNSLPNSSRRYGWL